MWFRVNEPLSPLHGCDVKGQFRDDLKTELLICAVRRVDIFMGDRPFQLVAAEGSDLGLWIRANQLEPSRIQDEIVELSTTAPYGKFIKEQTISGKDQANLTVVEYEDGFQIALIYYGVLIGSVFFGKKHVQHAQSMIQKFSELSIDANDVAWEFERQRHRAQNQQRERISDG